MRSGWPFVLVVLVLLTGCGKSDKADEAAKEEAASDDRVVLSEDQVKSLGIATVAVKAAAFRSGVSGYGVVVPLDTIGQADSDFLAAQAVAAQSQAAAARAQYLFSTEGGAVSRESMEAAQSKAAADRAALALARRKAEAIFGHNAPWEKSGSRRAIMDRLTSGRTVLVRVTFPLSSLGRLPMALSVARLGVGTTHWPAAAIWEAPADPTFPGPSILALVEGSDLAQNDHVIATVPTGAPAAGVTVPSGALVYSEDRAWAYLEAAPRSYRRVPVSTANPTEGGYFLAQGVAPGARVVTAGAGLLLARERNPSTEPEE
ncbi:MAG TPA: hypothetical protein VJS85_04935 [Rhizomicrobium sp.]|nr:hypothetical protein [Rhizomicrobium sp.]